MYRSALLGFLLLARPPLGPLAAQTAHQHDDPGVGGTGRVHFATRCNPSVQPSLEQGVALLHSFWYEASQKTFDETIRLDPTCPFGYCGQAMREGGSFEVRRSPSHDEFPLTPDPLPLTPDP